MIVDLAAAPAVDVVPLAAGDNDLLDGDLPRSIVRRLHQIARRIQPLGGRVILNTIYVLNVPARDRTLNQRAGPSLQGRATLGYGRR